MEINWLSPIIRTSANPLFFMLQKWDWLMNCDYNSQTSIFHTLMDTPFQILFSFHAETLFLFCFMFIHSLNRNRHLPCTRHCAEARVKWGLSFFYANPKFGKSYLFISREFRQLLFGRCLRTA